MNQFTQTSSRVSKLVDQHNLHGSIVIGVDFDFTIYNPIDHSMHMDIIDLLLQSESAGCKLCLWTANSSRIPYILHKCESIGLNFQYINESPIHIEHKVIKPHFNLLLDDTAGLGQAVEILEQFLKELS